MSVTDNIVGPGGGWVGGGGGGQEHKLLIVFINALEIKINAHISFPPHF